MKILLVHSFGQQMSIYNLIWFFFDFQNLLWNVILKIVHKRWKNKVLSNISSHLNISLHVCQDSSWNNCRKFKYICVIYKQSYQFSKYLFCLKNQIWIIQRKKNHLLDTQLSDSAYSLNMATVIYLYIYIQYFSVHSIWCIFFLGPFYPWLFLPQEMFCKSILVLLMNALKSINCQSTMRYWFISTALRQYISFTFLELL